MEEVAGDQLAEDVLVVVVVEGGKPMEGNMSSSIPKISSA
jgi:hypothetical protein